MVEHMTSVCSLSGAMERGHNMVYVCLDNGAYMNTGIQRSSATLWVQILLQPCGKSCTGKQQPRKDLTAIMAAHNIPYAAQASISNWQDVHKRQKRRLMLKGQPYKYAFLAREGGGIIRLILWSCAKLPLRPVFGLFTKWKTVSGY